MLATTGKVIVAILDTAATMLRKLVGYALLFVVAVFLIATGAITLAYYLATR